MEKQEILQALQNLQENAEERGFTQSVDFIVNLRDLDLNKPDEKVDFFITLPHNLGKKKKVAAFIGPELEGKVEDIIDEVVKNTEFDEYKNKKVAKNLARKYDYFIAQADIMPQVATNFGRYLGPRGKMPNPKLGSVVNPKSDIEAIYEKLQNTSHVVAKKDPVIQVKVGNQEMSEEDVAENVLAVYNMLLNNLVSERNNVKDVYLKYTMSTPEQLI